MIKQICKPNDNFKRLDIELLMTKLIGIPNQ